MFNRRGQNIAEYSIVIAIVIAAAVAMQTYVKRGLQGRVRDAVDTTGNTNGAVTFTGAQYEPYYINSDANIDRGYGYTENLGARGQTNRTGINETTTRGTGAYERMEAPTAGNGVSP
ncbi:MAG: hypothetical protein HY350_02760 [Candidatus Omnitrophica bacterium]|nr:hypothetical protein [Candidatus Omnitrophota bacterium]